VKNEGYNFNAMTKALKLVVNCEALSLEESFQEHVLAMFFPKFLTMLQPMKKFENLKIMF
jgi:hypothetical protein